MQIIGGIASGIQLSVPRGFSVRPTVGRSRKSLFDSIGNLTGLSVADFFAGSGALGLEAASRGAEKVYFLESDQRNCRMISENIAKVAKAGVLSEMKVVCSDVIRGYGRLPSIDMIIADPPYDETTDLLSSLLSDAKFAEWAKQAVLIWELPQDSRSDDVNNVLFESKTWKMLKKRKFGDAEFLWMKTS
ncbi:MAG: RsmD family RNA methyltransferase [Victivallales bacterium]